MEMDGHFPRMRPLEVHPVEMEGEAYLLLHDPAHHSEDVALPRQWASVLSLLDGTRDLKTVALAHALRFQAPLALPVVERLVSELDRHLVLDSPRFQEHRQQLEQAFLAEPVRPAAFAGRSYPAQPDELRALLDELLEEAAGLEVPAPVYEPGHLQGVVVPHIDFGRGGVTEALAYRCLAQQQFDVLVVLGIAHQGVDYPFAATTKPFKTPLGTTKVDQEFLDTLQSRVGSELLGEQLAHRDEHSVEFVTVFLQHLPPLRSAKMVPLLCGGFHGELEDGSSPLQQPRVQRFVDGLRETVQQWEAAGQRVGFIASVDLAHVGTQFGDPTPLIEPRLQEVRLQDRRFLDLAATGDPAGLHQHLAEDGNARHVDAHPALWTLLTAFPHLRGQLLHYQQAHSPEQNIMVSFATMALYKAEG